ncbi:MAG TPA: MarR family transcriptional regulator [Vicinamibacteria bacterium]|nr:MarR family transcriptional regulator [Vicinamibacteria bacterium]
MSSGFSTDTQETARRLHSAAIHLLRALRRQDTASGVGPARLSALSVLVFGGSTTLGALADAEQVRPPTMSRIVAGLEADGLVRREPDEQDGRRAHIHATAAGRRLLERARDRRVDQLAGWVGALAPADRAHLAEAVGILEGMLAGQAGR